MHRRLGLGPQFLAKMRHYPFDRAKAHRDALLSGKLLADHIGIASMAAKALSNPRLQSVQRFRAHGWRWFAPSTLGRHRRAVGRKRPSSTALRRAHQPSDFSFGMAEKSSAPSSHRVQTLGLRQRFSR